VTTTTPSTAHLAMANHPSRRPRRQSTPGLYLNTAASSSRNLSEHFDLAV
jgi:hypothetical protein